MRNPGRDSFWWVNFPWVMLGSAIEITLVKLTAFLEPYGLYFTFTALLYENQASLAPGAFFIHFLIPILTGTIIGLFLLQNPRGTAGCASFLASILLLWPAIWYWDEVIPYSIQNKRVALSFVYTLHVIAETFLAVLGAVIGQSISNWYSTNPSRGSLGNTLRSIPGVVIREIIAWRDGWKTVFFGSIAGLLAEYLIKAILEEE